MWLGSWQFPEKPFTLDLIRKYFLLDLIFLNIAPFLCFIVVYEK